MTQLVLFTARLRLIGTLIIVGYAAYAIIGGMWVQVAVSAAVLLVTLGGTSLAIIALPCILLFGQPVWLFVGLSVFAICDAIYDRAPPTALVEPASHADLARLLADVDHAVIERLRRNGLLDTSVLIDCSAADFPNLWPSGLTTDRRGVSDASDAETDRLQIQGSTVTIRALEACALALSMNTRYQIPMTIHLWAGAAALISDSYVAIALRDRGYSPIEVGRDVTGLNEVQLRESVVGFLRSSTGIAYSQRVEGRAPESVTRESLSEMDTDSARSRPTISGIVRQLGEAARTVFVDLIQEARDFRRFRRLAKAEKRAKVAASAASPHSWPTVVLWRGIRPALTLAAITLLWFFTSVSVVAIAAVAVSVIIRPVTRWRWNVLLIGAFVYVSPPAAVPLLARWAVTEITLWKLGASDLTRRRNGGYEAIRMSRRLAFERMIEDGKIAGRAEDAWQDTQRTVASTDEMKVLDSCVAYAASAVCEADARVQAFAAYRLARGLTTGRWGDSAEVPNLTKQMVRVAARDNLLLVVLALIAAGLAFTYGLRIDLDVLPVLGIDGGPIVAIAGAFAVLCVSTTKPKWLTGAMFVTIAIGLGGRDGVLLGLAAGATGIAIGALRRLLTRMSLNGLSLFPRPSIRLTGVRYYHVFSAASTLVSRGLPGMAVAVLVEAALAHPSPRHRTVASLALSYVSAIELSRNRLQAAVEASERAALARRDVRSAYRWGLISYHRGTALLRAGDRVGAITYLTAASTSLPKFSPEFGIALTRLGEALAQVGRYEDAIVSLRAALDRPRRAAMHRVLDSLVPTAEALASVGQVDEAQTMLGDVVTFTDYISRSSLTPALWEGSDALSVTIGRANLLLGHIKLVAGAHTEAAVHLRRAVIQLPNAGEAAAGHGSAHILLGRCQGLMNQHVPAIKSVREGVGVIEARRGQLRSSGLRTSAVMSELNVYKFALDAVVAAQGASVADVGWLAGDILESMRRNALAQTLREGREEFQSRLSSTARELLASIASEGAAVGLDQRDLETSQVRTKLSDAVSEAFAAVYVPEQSDIKSIVRHAQLEHVLYYSFFSVSSELWCGYRVWIPPGGEAHVDAVQIDEPALIQLLGWNHSAQEHLIEPLALSVQKWARLADCLLPLALRGELALQDASSPVRILIVPGDHLALVPWGALRLDADDPLSVLITKAVIRLVPSLSSLKDDSGEFGAMRVCAHVSDELDVHGGGLLPGGLHLSKSAEQFIDRLQYAHWDGAYLLAHGSGSGLDQRVTLSGGYRLSAAGAMTLRWPKWVFFASCFAGGVREKTGSEPLGLPIACMIGGSRSIIGGVIEVTAGPTAIIARDVLKQLNLGEDTALALRNSQLANLDDDPSAAVRDFAGLVCISNFQIK